MGRGWWWGEELRALFPYGQKGPGKDPQGGHPRSCGWRAEHGGGEVGSGECQAGEGARSTGLQGLVGHTRIWVFIA